MPAPWTDLVKSAAARRSRDAPFFKPVCLVAIIDLIEEGRVDPADIDVEHLLERVSKMVEDVHIGRPDMRWRPIWHLSNDGAWNYTKAGRRIGPEDFEPARKPDSLREWRQSFDKVAVPTAMLPHWQSATDRAALRHAAWAMLENGDEACRRVATRWRTEISTEDAIAVRGTAGHGQGFLADAGARRAIERHAMTVATECFEAEGWAVIDRSATESYDLLAEAGEQTLFVEVKGTTGRGDVIELTRREVEFAQTNRERMALAVVAHIVLTGVREEATASGGELVVRRPWAPEPSALRPISFTCQLE